MRFLDFDCIKSHYIIKARLSCIYSHIISCLIWLDSLFISFLKTFSLPFDTNDKVCSMLITRKVLEEDYDKF